MVIPVPPPSARGEDVLDVPATLASRVRTLATNRSNKNDPNDAHSIAIAALRAPMLRCVERADHGEVLRLLAKRNMDIGNHRTRVVCRLHALLAELAPGGMAKEMYVSEADVFMAKLRPETPAQQMRFDLALELLDDVRRLDAQLKESHRRIRVAIKASGTSLIELYGVGPIIAATLIGYSGDITRFRQPRRLRLLQRHGTHRVLLGGTNCASGVHSGQPQAQPCLAHGCYHPAP